MIKNNHLLKFLLMNLTCHISHNTLMDSGINSDSDHQEEWTLMLKDLVLTVLLVLPKTILIVTMLITETEPYLSSSNLGLPHSPNQPMNSVLMISVETLQMSVNKLNSNIPMLMLCGSMSIQVSLKLIT
jgi:hypothetical protein